jgi:hypothetical protein
MIMNRIAPVATASVALVLILAGCSSAKPDDTGRLPDTAPVATADPTPEPTATPKDSEFGEAVTSSRGNLVKEIGQLAGTSSGTTDVVTSRFAVTDIVLDRECTSGFAEAPVNGHYLGIHLNVETTPELAQDDFPWVSFTQYDWQAYDADGKRLNDPVANAWSCLDPGEQLPAQIGPGQNVSGWIVLDVAATTGAVVLTMAGSPTGWEWAY